jgi:hypothetical protein
MKITKDVYDELKTLKRAYIDQNGKEVNNPMPLAVDSGLKRPPTLKEQIQRVLRQEVSAQAHAQGHETFEEAQDFDIGLDDDEPLSGYEVVDMVPEEPVAMEVNQDTSKKTSPLSEAGGTGETGISEPPVSEPSSEVDSSGE